MMTPDQKLENIRGRQNPLVRRWVESISARLCDEYRQLDMYIGRESKTLLNENNVLSNIKKFCEEWGWELYTKDLPGDDRLCSLYIKPLDENLLEPSISPNAGE
jgi:hypothetical protein